MQQVYYKQCSNFTTNNAASLLQTMQQVYYKRCSKFTTNNAASLLQTMQVYYKQCSKFTTNNAARVLVTSNASLLQTMQQVYYKLLYVAWLYEGLDKHHAIILSPLSQKKYVNTRLT